MELRNMIKLGWCLTIITLIYFIIEPFRWLPEGVDVVIYVCLVTSVGLLLGVLRYGWKDYIIFFLITFIISNILENTSILTGFPFGHYYYSDNLGLKLFLVPLVIAPAYFAMGYLSWSIAHILQGQYDVRPRGANVFFIPLIAAFVMVSWDVVMDPSSSTMDQNWIWLNGGSYWGVPFTNFLGWFFTVYLFFQAFALYLSCTRRDQGVEAVMQPKSYWYIPCVVYGAVAYGFIYDIFNLPNKAIIDHTSRIWMAHDIATSTGLVSIFTLVFIALVAILRVKLDDRVPVLDRLN